MNMIRLTGEIPKILYQDANLLVVFKPAGLDVFPSKQGRKDSLWSWLWKQMPSLDKVGNLSAPAIAHRLDRYTSGLLLVARDNETYLYLRNVFRKKDVVKEYIALVEGVLEREVTVDLPLGSRYRRSKKISVALTGKRLRGVLAASTLVRPLGVAQGMTLCNVQTSSGLRHQVRAHLGFLDHPIAQDVAYGAKKNLPLLGDRFFLHAWKIRFPHPQCLSPCEFVCPLSHELMQTCNELGLRAP